MNISYFAMVWLDLCMFVRKIWRSILLASCLLYPETLLYLIKTTHNNKRYSVSVKEDEELEDHITLFFYLFPHNCTELTNYIKFIYKYHPFYKWRSHEFTIAVSYGESIVVFNPFTKINVETGKKLMFGLIEFDQDD